VWSKFQDNDNLWVLYNDEQYQFIVTAYQAKITNMNTYRDIQFQRKPKNHYVLYVWHNWQPLIYIEKKGGTPPINIHLKIKVRKWRAYKRTCMYINFKTTYFIYDWLWHRFWMRIRMTMLSTGIDWNWWRRRWFKRG